MTAADQSSHAFLMDGIYRHQKHIYDATRKYYLLGRDRMIDGLAVPTGGSVLELGCGTGRNLVLAARQYPHARLFGLDISSEMLAAARQTLGRHGLSARTVLQQGDATDFDALALFGQAEFDRVFFSYTLSMIPDWEAAISAALSVLKPSGSLHIVDFGQQRQLPAWFRGGLHAWLSRFHVEPRADLRDELAIQARLVGGNVCFHALYRDYAWLATVRPGES